MDIDNQLLLLFLFFNDDDDQYYACAINPSGHHHIYISSSLSFTIYLLSKHCNSLSNGCVTKRTSSHSRYIGSTISTQTKMIARTKQDSFLSILTNHTQLSIIYQSGLWKYKYTMNEQSHSSVHTISKFRCLPFSVVVSLDCGVM